MAEKYAWIRSRFGFELTLHVIGWLLTSVLLWFVLDLRHVDFHYPMALDAAGDGVYYGALVKIMLETGWFYEHADLGAPFGLALYDFPHFDALHLLVMKLIGYAVNDWAMVLNIYYLLTFYLTTSAALVLFRHLNFQSYLALALALLYSFQPYHLERGQGHIMLAAYYHLPLLTLALVWLLQPQGLRDGEAIPLRRSWRFWAACLFAGLGTFAGHYYIAFVCLAYLLAGCYSAAHFRRWAPLLQAGLLLLVAALAFTINLLPNRAYWHTAGANREISIKPTEFVEIHSLRLVQMLLPVPDHRVRPLRSLSSRYLIHTPFQLSERSAAIGLIAGVGLVGLLAVGLFGGSRQPDDDTAGKATFAVPVRGLATVLLGLLLFSTMSGFGAVFAYVVTPQFHGLNRVSIYLALLGLLAVGMAASWLIERTRRRQLAAAVVLTVGALGLFDLLPSKQLLNPRKTNTQFLEPRQFAEAIQNTVPRGTSIYWLPGSTFPFSAEGGYRYLLPYLFTEGLHWSEPAMRYRRSAEWQQNIEALPCEQFLEQLVLTGFEGIVLDEKGRKSPLLKAVKEHLRGPGGLEPIEGDGWLFFDLRAYAARIRERYSPDQWSVRSFNASRPLSLRWDPKFLSLERGETNPDWKSWRWCTAKRATIEVINYHPSPLAANLHMRLFGADAAYGGFELSGALLPATGLSLPRDGTVDLDVVVPPGKHRLTVTYQGEQPLKSGGHSLWFRVDSFHLNLPEPGPAAGKQAVTFSKE